MSRLGFYMIGVSIGLVLLGLWQMERRSLLARSQAEAQAQQAELARKQAEQLGLPAPASVQPQQAAPTGTAPASDVKPTQPGPGH